MRHQTREFVQKFLTAHEGPFRRVLDVGSLDVNGHIRDLFPEGYTGIDMMDGPNVDRVINGHELMDHFPKNSFDLVMCFDTFEHDDAFWATHDEMMCVLKPGGYILIGVPGRNHPEHRHPKDYWRFMPQSFEDFFLKGLEDTHMDVQTDNPDHDYEDEIYGWGRKPA